MVNPDKIAEMVRCAIKRTRIERHSSITITVNDDGTVAVEGEVPELAAKKLALEAAGGVARVSGIVDRLRVSPVERKGDGEIRDHVRDAIAGDPAFLEHKIGTESAPSSGRYALSITVREGVVTLDGVVASLSHKRLAGALAWWVPGTRDVINGLEVDPPEQDSDEEIVESLRLVLEKDPLVDADTIQVTSANSIVTLSGIATDDKERRAAEHDAWSVFGVNKVVNQLVVRKGPAQLRRVAMSHSKDQKPEVTAPATPDAGLICGDWMTSAPKTVRPRDSVAYASSLLEQYTINQLPVVEEGILVGIVTDRDLRAAVRTAAAAAKLAGRTEAVPQQPDKIPVEAVMTRNVITLAPHSTLGNAALVMRRERIGSVPIVDHGRMVGIVTRSDVLDAFLSRENFMRERKDRIIPSGREALRVKGRPERKR